MQINLERADKYSVESYSDTEIKVDSIIFQESVIISKNEIISPWPVQALQDINETTLKPLLQLNPKVILIGHNQLSTPIPFSVIQYLSTLQIGIESMTIGAASRTFNVLLSEFREVVLGVIFRENS